MNSFDLTKYKVVTMDDIEAALKAGATELLVRDGAICTPSASDAISAKSLTLKSAAPGQASSATPNQWDALFHSPEAELIKAQDELSNADFYLGASLYGEGRYRESAAAYEKSAKFRTDDSTLLNNWGMSLHDAGDYAEAEPLLRRALAITEKALGPDHPNTATSLNNLAGLLESSSDYAGAEPLYRRALAIREKALGPDHPDTATSLNNLAWLLESKSDYAGAEPLFRRALAITEKALGPDHPATRTVRRNLNDVLKKSGK